MNKFLGLIIIFLIVSCGGGGSSSSSESGSQATSSVSNSSNSSSNSSNSSSSTSNSQDSAANIVNQTGCTPLVTGSNEADNDADGVINLFDICPNNPEITKALSFDFSNVTSYTFELVFCSNVQT